MLSNEFLQYFGLTSGRTHVAAALRDDGPPLTSGRTHVVAACAGDGPPLTVSTRWGSLTSGRTHAATAFTELKGGIAGMKHKDPPLQKASNDELDKDLEKDGGVDKSLDDSGATEDDVLATAKPPQIIRDALPRIDLRKHDKLSYKDLFTMKSKYPGGDIMHQGMFEKWRQYSTTGATVQVPPEEDWYAGARLGEYARPLIMDENKVGYLNQAPVPMSQSEDLLTIISEAGVGSRRARHAALYAKASAGQAEEFFRLAQRRLRQVLRDPPLTVAPGGDVYPMYAAAAPALLALAAPPCASSTLAAQPRLQRSATEPLKRAQKDAKRLCKDDFF